MVVLFLIVQEIEINYHSLKHPADLSDHQIYTKHIHSAIAAMHRQTIQYQIKVMPIEKQVKKIKL